MGFLLAYKLEKKLALLYLKGLGILKDNKLELNDCLKLGHVSSA